MKLSPLQKARYSYNPKLPGMLRNGISNICVKVDPTSPIKSPAYVKSVKRYPGIEPYSNFAILYYFAPASLLN